MMSFLNWLIVPAIWVVVMVVLILLSGFILHKIVKGLEWVSKKMGKPQVFEILIHNFELPLEYTIRVFIVDCIGAILISYCFSKPDAVLELYGKITNSAYIALLSWGFWRSSDLATLLLQSAENQLDLNTGKTMRTFFISIYHVIITVFAAISFLDLLGVPVTSLLAGAGVVALAISMAAQSTLSNLIAGITLVLEHPFGIGDYVILGDYEGIVEAISFRSTRIRTADKVEITVENASVCSQYIQNAQRRTLRLWDFVIGVTYDTPREKIEKLIPDLRELLLADEHVSPENLIIALQEFGGSSMDIRVRGYVKTTALADFLNLKSHLNLQIIDLMNCDGCSFAFPSTSVYIEKQ